MTYHTVLSLLIIESSLGMDPNAARKDPNTARMEFFAEEISEKWVVIEKRHEYQLKGMRQQLG